MGGAPEEEEEDCTVEQLSALNKRVHTLDLPPYVDLGVWQPYGRRALRASKFKAWFPRRLGVGSMINGLRPEGTTAIMLDILPLASSSSTSGTSRGCEALPFAWHLAGREVGQDPVEDLG